MLEDTSELIRKGLSGEDIYIVPPFTTMRLMPKLAPNYSIAFFISIDKHGYAIVWRALFEERLSVYNNLIFTRNFCVQMLDLESCAQRPIDAIYTQIMR